MSSAAKVGAFMLIILAVVGYFVLKIEDVDLARGGTTRKIRVAFDNVAGLEPKSAVRVAGVRKGKVTEIDVVNGKATVTAKVVLAADGKSRTVTQTGTDAQGKPVNNMIFYDKQ